MDDATFYIITNDRLNRDYKNMDQIVENIMYEFQLIEPKKLENAVKKNMQIIKKFLAEHGIQFSQLKIYAKQASKITNNCYKKGLSPKVTSSYILNSVISKAIKKVVKGVKFKENETKLDLKEKIIRSIILFGLLTIVDFMIIEMLGGTFGLNLPGSVVTNIITVVIGPLVEETAKRISILQKFPWVYTGIFAGIEGITYVSKMLCLGVPLSKAVIVRLIAVLIHFATTFIQKVFRDKVEQGVLSKNWDYVGFITAVGIHSLWNAQDLLGVNFLRLAGIV